MAPFFTAFPCLNSAIYLSRADSGLLQRALREYSPTSPASSSVRKCSMEELLGSYIIFIILLFIETKGIPPITLAIIILNMFIFLAPELNVAEVCLSVNTTFYSCEWQRLLLAPLHHIDVDHLGFNMASLVWKGSRMERRIGSARFMFSTFTFGILTGLTYLSIKAALACLLTERFNMDCAVGFSGILFALKVINNGHSADGDIPGPFQIKRRDACWAELILIHLLSPRSSFVGHLAGILVGLAYVKGPLKMIINWFTGKEYGNVRFMECCHHSLCTCQDQEFERGGFMAPRLVPLLVARFFPQTFTRAPSGWVVGVIGNQLVSSRPPAMSFHSPSIPFHGASMATTG
ncbi:rhomboid-related protein 4-like [Carcharodon carcharias]|uniref:rhomboid-related protein 4-like n=1 Tax=Carcharodon carcharias TaxID=13397 RepID=UPI001B7E7301|nr:rhomboid-related protein 4-like [Carcharodon carcharias]